MARCGLMCLLLVSVAWGQNGNTTSSAPAQNAETQKTVTSPPPANKIEDVQFAADKVPQDAPIITVTGLCTPAPSGKTKSTECKTVITRAEFEKIVDLLQPNSTQEARKLLANTYIQTLVKAQKAQEMGLDKRPDFDSRLDVLRLLIDREAVEDTISLQEWNKVTDKEIDDYYHNHISEFVQMDVERLFVPWFEPDEDPNKKLSEAEKQKRNQEWNKTLKEEAEKLHARALAGEDFLDLQKEAYKFTDVTSNQIDRSEITLPGFRRNMFTGGLRSVVDMEPGKISPVLSEDNGYYVFRMMKKSTLPLNDRVKAEIHSALRNERVKRDKDAIEQLAVSGTTYNDNYFGPQLPDAKKP